MDATILVVALGAMVPGLIESEFSENAISRSHDTLRQQVQDIKSLGSKIAIDDFGGSLSDRSYLKNIPADHIETDQSFIHGMQANHTDRMIVAEDIECQEILALQQKTGCDHSQGYAIAHPMQANEMGTRQRLADCAG
jgi:EAL domain-containing protein (putative c-di-GMP-specific phosphodiesterase class I)